MHQSSESLETEFGRILCDLRTTCGLSQEELGFQSGYHRTYISLLERGRKVPTLRTLFRIARALRVAPSDIVAKLEHIAADPKPSVGDGDK